MVKLITEDKAEILLETQYAMQFGLIKNLIEDLGEESSDLGIPLKDVSLETMTTIIDYLKYSEENKDSEDKFKDLPFFDYVKMDDENDRDKLFQVLIAANYLDHEKLLNIGCKKVAEYIKGKPCEEIKKILKHED